MQYVFLEYSIDCAHFLPNVPEGHKCGKMHGHRYDIRLEMMGEPDPKSGWIMDYADIKTALDPIIMALDHQTLNDIPGLSNPTCENIVWYLREKITATDAAPYDRDFIHLASIDVRETNRAGAGWRKG